MLGEQGAQRSPGGVRGLAPGGVAFYTQRTGAYGGPFSPSSGMFVPIAYWGAPGPDQGSVIAAEAPFQKSGAHHPGEPILAMDSLKARIMEAAPGEVKNLIGSVQFVPRAAAFTSLIQMAAKTKQPQKAIEIFESMSAVGVEPNTFSYSALISALARAGRWQEAERYFSELEACSQRDPGIRPNTVTYAALISAYEKGGQLQRALAAFRRQLVAGVPPDLITYSSLISACERAGELGGALELLAQMHSDGLTGNHPLYHGLLLACGAAGEWEAALEAFLGMQCATLRPTAHTVHLLMGALAAGGQAAHALCLLREALRHRYDLGVSTYNQALQLLAGAGDWRRALGVARAMRLAGAAPDATTAGLLVAACVQGGQQELGGRLAADFAAQGLIKPLPPPPPPSNGHNGTADNGAAEGQAGETGGHAYVQGSGGGRLQRRHSVRSSAAAAASHSGGGGLHSPASRAGSRGGFPSAKE